MYKVNSTEFESFTKAVEYASSISADVIEIATGRQRWTPPPPVSAKRVRMYRERLAAYEAQSRMKKV